MNSNRLRTIATCACVSLAFGASPVAAPAASTGIAFDSVNKFAIGGQSDPVPGTFSADFTTASSAAHPSTKRGPFGLGAAIAAASGAMSMFKNGTAERHYIAGQKQRVDSLASNEARIVDCSARTLTTLDLKNKTFTVVSLDQPIATAPPESKRRDRRDPAPSGTDDGTKVALSMTTRALGPRQLEGVATTGYDAHLKMTTTRPTGESGTFDSDFTSYLSTIAEPREGCPEAEARLRLGESGQKGAAMEQFAMAMRAMKTPKGDPRFTVTASGPAMPTGKLALWQNMKMGGGDSAAPGPGGFSVLIERGNIRAITDADPIFTVPSDFTKG